MSKKDDTSSQEQEQHLAERIKGSARQIWLAGLGAYTKAEEDAGRIFDKLVKEGEEIEHKTRGVVEKQLKAVEDTVGGVRDRAGSTLGKLETVFDKRVSQTLKRLGVALPSHQATLEQRLEELESRVTALEAQGNNGAKK